MIYEVTSICSTLIKIHQYWGWSESPVGRVQLFVILWTVVLGILQARILERVAFPFSRGPSQPRNQTQVSCIVGRFFTSWATRKALNLEGEVRLKTRLKLKYLSCDYDLILVWTSVIFLPELNKQSIRQNYIKSNYNQEFICFHIF